MGRYRFGIIPVTLDNYFRVIPGRHASSSGTLSDQLNTIGYHLGGLVCHLDWRGDGWKAAFMRDVPYSYYRYDAEMAIR